MINRQALLADLQKFLQRIEADLLDRSESTEVPEVPAALRAEYEKASRAERTAQNYEDWRTDTITQAAAAWVLSCVFVRFLEDNSLIDPPKIAGPGKRLARARDEHELYFRSHPQDTDREYLLSIFAALAKLPGTRDIFGEHNAINDLPNWLSGDAAGELLNFFRKIDASTGNIVHDFTDSNWGTRFLGDLYQDLSEAARKKYALLQTPEFVEEFILDRTLNPALDEFGLDALPLLDCDGKPITEAGFRMIDPACGSGHFLLGAFPRILERWQRKEPGTHVRELVQRSLDSVFGVDINPYAVAIARFRLLLVAMRSCNLSRLLDAPGFRLSLVCGDSLLHAPLSGGQHVLDFELAEESDACDHAYRSENLPELKRLLRGGQYHAVVANPPYIVPNDATINLKYRQRFPSCYRAYSLAVPFMERIFRLAAAHGFTGQITANSFMKREFGKKLIETFFPGVDVTHVLDTSAVEIPGHNTPTAIIFGRHRPPIQATVRVVSGIKGANRSAGDADGGPVWRSMTSQIDESGYRDEYVNVLDVERLRLAKHPWTLSGGDSSQLVKLLEDASVSVLGHESIDTGAVALTRDDESFVFGERVARRSCLRRNESRIYIAGENIRDWCLYPEKHVIWPYDELGHNATAPVTIQRLLWRTRAQLRQRRAFGKTQLEHGLKWFEYSMLFMERYSAPVKIAYANVSTHNHFALIDKLLVLNAHAPVIILKNVSPIAIDSLLGVLNSSTICFWMKQVCQPKGTATGDVSTEKFRPEANRFEFGSTALSKLPLPDLTSETGQLVAKLSQAMRHCVTGLENTTPKAVIAAWRGNQTKALRTMFADSQQLRESLRCRMIAIQEEIDWATYVLYGLANSRICTFVADDESIGIGSEERPFLWSDNTAPSSMPAKLSEIYVERRSFLNESPWLAVLETKVHKRLWQGRQGVYGSANLSDQDAAAAALQSFLLDKLESYFDFDGRMNEAGNATTKIEISLVSVAKLSDIARQDVEFQSVGEVYRDDSAFDVQALVTELIAAECVPLLPILRYKPSGLIKRGIWERTWNLQRQEDAIDAQAMLPCTDPQFHSEVSDRDLKREQLCNIPVPTKYDSKDYLDSHFWRLRGKLDVPQERWISFPHCEGPDGTLVICWAGYDHLQQAQAISAYYIRVQTEFGGSDDPRLIPLLASLIELLPWLAQWHNEPNANFDGLRMGDYFESFVNEEARNLGKTLAEIKAWVPPRKVSKAKPTKSKKKSVQADIEADE
jgi:hypothetical protein